MVGVRVLTYNFVSATEFTRYIFNSVTTISIYLIWKTVVKDDLKKLFSALIYTRNHLLFIKYNFIF